MGLYLFCLCFGFAGLLIMAVLGHTHSGTDHGHAHGHGHGDGHAGHGSHTHSATDSHSSHGHDANGHAKFSAAAWLSPRVLFSLVFAFGASGYLLRHLLPPLAVLLASLLLAWLFERWIIQPVWRVLFGFASHEAQTLESALFEEAEAVTNFDGRGHGLVALNLGGEVVQVLAVLNESDRTFGVRIRTGDKVSVTAVDTRRNSCTVARLPLSAPR